MFRRPDAVEAQRLREIAERDSRLHILPIGLRRGLAEIAALYALPIFRVVREHADIDFHRTPSR